MNDQTSTTGVLTPTLAEMLAGFDKAIAAFAKMDDSDRRLEESLADAMREKGFDPSKGGCIIVPPSITAKFRRLPDFVFSSPFIDNASLINFPPGLKPKRL